MHRLELWLVGGVMLLVSAMVAGYLLVRPQAAVYSHQPPQPLAGGRAADMPARAATPQSLPAAAGIGAHGLLRGGAGSAALAGVGTLGGLLLLGAAWLRLHRPAAARNNARAASSARLSIQAASNTAGAEALASERRIGRATGAHRLLRIAHDDPVVRARGELLKGATCMVACCGLIALAITAARGQPGASLRDMLALLLLCGGVFLLAERGNVQAGGLLLGLGLLPVIFSLERPPQLLERPLGAALVLPVFIVGMVVGARAVNALGTLIVAMIVGLALLSGGDGRWALDLLMLSGVEIGLLWLTLRSLEHALLTARHAAQLERERGMLERQQLDLERQAIALESRLDQQQEARDFIGYFIHELGGLTTGARGIAEVLAPTARQDDELFGLLRHTIGEVDMLIDDLKILVRQGSLSRYQYRPLALEAFCAQAARLALPSGEEPQVGQNIAEGLVLYGDEKLLLRALVTALRNAAEAIARRDGPEEGSIRLHGYEQGGWICLRIEDSGPGFEPDLLRQMRSLAARPAGSLPAGWFSNKSGGTGRGIPLMEQVARLHQGSLAFGNHPGRDGAWVLFKLPGLARLQPAAETPAGET